MSKTTGMIEEWIAAWSAHDLQRLCALFTDDCVYEDVTMSVVNHGPGELAGFATSFFEAMPDVTFKLVTSVTEGDKGAAEWRLIGTHQGEMPGLPAANGGHCDLRGMSVFEVRDGKFSRCSDHWNMEDFLRQLGHID